MRETIFKVIVYTAVFFCHFYVCVCGGGGGGGEVLGYTCDFLFGFESNIKGSPVKGKNFLPQEQTLSSDSRPLLRRRQERQWWWNCFPPIHLKVKKCNEWNKK